MLYKHLIRPRLFRMDPEEAHNMVADKLHWLGRHQPLAKVVQTLTTVEDPWLSQRLFGMEFPNPIGLAAGMDKSGRSLLGWQALGFGFLEMGGVVPRPQEGNPKPRMFRIPEEQSLINRMGFNSPGVGVCKRILQSVCPHLRIPLGINVGKNKDTPNTDAVHDYVCVVERLFDYASFFVVNVSSPNTANLRELQEKGALSEICAAVIQVCHERRISGRRKPVLLKVAPDLTNAAFEDVFGVVQDHHLDGLVVANTTMSREGLKHDPGEIGGLSGPHLRKRMLEMVRHAHGSLPHLPIIAVGGISSGEQAAEVLAAGAVLVQAFTGLVYEGPALPRRLNRGVLSAIKKYGWKDMTSLHPQVKRD